MKAGDRICHAASNPLIHEIVYARGDVWRYTNINQRSIHGNTKFVN